MDNGRWLVRFASAYLPAGMPYDAIVGGACRDAMTGDSIRDLDIFFWSRESFVQATAALCMHGWECCRVHTSYDYAGGTMVCFRWRSFHPDPELRPWWPEGRSVDFMVLGGAFADPVSVMRKRFDFTVNCCMLRPQVSDEIEFVHPRAADHLRHRRLEMNASEMGLARIVCRARQFQERGWKVGSSVVQSAIAGLDAPDDETLRRYSKRAAAGLRRGWNWAAVREDLFSIIDDDQLVLAMLSNDDRVREWARDEQRTRSRERARKPGWWQKWSERVRHLLPWPVE